MQGCDRRGRVSGTFGHSGDAVPRSALLEQAVVAEAQATVLLASAKATLPARFASVSSETVTLLLYGEAPPVAEGTVACVYHAFGAAQSAFLAPVVSLRSFDGGDYLTVQRPGEMAQLDQRRAFRVPVAQGRLAATLWFADEPYAAEVVDLSCFGTQLRFVDAPQLLVAGQPGVVAFAEDETVVKGRIVRRVPRGCAVAFTPGPDGRPDSRLATLVSQLERDWLTAHRQSVATPG